MLREIAVLVAVFVSLFLFVPYLFFPYHVGIAIMGSFPFMCLIAYSAYHIRNLLSKNPKKAIIFLSILLSLILIVSASIGWMVTHPSVSMA